MNISPNIQPGGRPLRFLLVLPMYGGSLPVGRYAAEALQELGHVVEVFEAPQFFSAFTGLKNLKVRPERLEQLENGFLNVVSQAVLAKTEQFEPDMVLTMAQAPLNRAALKRLERENICTAMWFVEDYRLFTYWRAFAPYYSLFFVIQKEPFLSELAAAGVPNAHYLPLAALPSFHRPLELTLEEKRVYGSELSFLGAGYANRRLAFRQLMNHDLKIWGSDWDGESVLARYIQAQGRRIDPQEAVKIFNASTINLNLHSSVRVDKLVSGGDFVNPRTFELAACEAFQLVDKRSLMPELFAEDELASFDSMQGLQELIPYYLAHPEERLQLARKARQRVLAEHTYAHRMQTLINATAATRPGWPKTLERSGYLEGIPLELQEELQELLERLELGGKPDFETLISRIRQQSGTLSSLETSLLFLDEWRKQYGG